MFESNRFAVKERVKFLKAYQSYDLFDADTGQAIGVIEETIGTLNQVLRWVISKALMPTRYEVRDTTGDVQFVIRRGGYIFRSRVEVLDADERLIGYFKSKVLTISGGFHVYTPDDTHFAEVKGKWLGFRFELRTPDGGTVLGTVSKEWGGMMREVFTSADSYLVTVNEELTDPMSKTLTLAAALAVDMVYKSESKGNDWLDG